MGKYDQLPPEGATNITIPALRRCLRTRKISLGALCQSDNINDRARYKPYAFPLLGQPLYGPTLGNESKIIQINFGMVPAVIKTPKNSVSQQATTATQHYAVSSWGQWRPPQGGVSEPFRMLDFYRYHHFAEDHIKEVRYTDAWGQTDAPLLTHNGLFRLEVEFNEARYSVRLTDMNGFANKYLTVVIANRNNNRWGESWIIAQSTNSLTQALVDSNNQPKAGTLKVEFNLRNVSGIGTKFNGYFLAVGVADKFTASTVAGQYTVTNYDGFKIVDYQTYPGDEKMPLTLYSFNMYKYAIREAWLGGMQGLPAYNVTKEFDVYCAMSNAGTITSQAQFTTKNGTSGIAVTFKGAVQMRVEEDTLDAQYKNTGYPAFGFWVDVFNKNGSLVESKEYVVVFEKGWIDGVDLTVNGTTLTFYSKKGEAQNLDAGTLDSLNAELLKNGIFIPCAETEVSIETGIYVRGGTSHEGDALYVPNIKDSKRFGAPYMPDELCSQRTLPTINLKK